MNKLKKGLLATLMLMCLSISAFAATKKERTKTMKVTTTVKTNVIAPMPPERRPGESDWDYFWRIMTS